MSTERPKRNARKRPDPDFFVDLPGQRSPQGKGIKRKLSLEADPEAPVSSPPPEKTLSLATQKNDKQQKKTRPCAVASCPAKSPICFLGASDRCVSNSYTARWYHITEGEHYCNECFEYFYRSNKAGYSTYAKWRRLWASNGRTEAGAKVFLADQYLPYWLQCNICHKWRQCSRSTDMTPEFITKYVCGMNSEGVKKEGKDSCNVPQDDRVDQVNSLEWLATMQVTPYLMCSPAAPYLKHYFPDGVGMSASCNMHLRVNPRKRGRPRKVNRRRIYDSGRDLSDGLSSSLSSSSSSSSSSSTSSSSSEEENSSQQADNLNGDPTAQIGYFQPFHQPGEALRAFCFHPDIMSEEELQAFQEFTYAQQMYLSLRNLIITLWCQNCKEWLTAEKCKPFLVCRGLGRIRGALELDRIITFLTRKGYINGGILDPPTELSVQHSLEDNVLIVGAGPAGLAAAQQLSRFGVKVTVLEARDRVGGRVWDESSMGMSVGHGAMIVIGCINNPVTLLCEQLGLHMRTILDRCDLLTESGSLTESDMDRRIDFHFNALLDNVAEWRKNRDMAQDTDLLSRINDMHKQFLEESQLTFTQDENLLLQFHISNLEYACGCDLGQASALHWDQNEAFPQFTGVHSMISEGYSAVLERLSQGLDVRLNTVVTNVDYTDQGVTVTTKSGEKITGSKIVLTLPVAVLQKGHVSFNPPLPESKTKAIHGLGAGIIEKVVIMFPNRFWDTKVKGADFFGHVPACEEHRGLFGVFYDITPREERTGVRSHVLMTWVSGPAIRLIEDKTDDEVVGMCLTVLRKLFLDEEVPDPVGSFVTHWGSDPYSLMSYSYVPAGSSGDQYDQMAQDVQNTIFFAGEATNRQFPQTVTGAYLSGIREADKILKDLVAPAQINQLIPKDLKKKKNTNQNEKENEGKKKLAPPKKSLSPDKKDKKDKKNTTTKKNLSSKNKNISPNSKPNGTPCPRPRGRPRTKNLGTPNSKETEGTKSPKGTQNMNRKMKTPIKKTPQNGQVVAVPKRRGRPPKIRPPEETSPKKGQVENGQVATPPKRRGRPPKKKTPIPMKVEIKVENTDIEEGKVENGDDSKKDGKPQNYTATEDNVMETSIVTNGNSQFEANKSDSDVPENVSIVIKNEAEDDISMVTNMDSTECFLGKNAKESIKLSIDRDTDATMLEGTEPCEESQGDCVSMETDQTAATGCSGKKDSTDTEMEPGHESDIQHEDAMDDDDKESGHEEPGDQSVALDHTSDKAIKIEIAPINDYTEMDVKDLCHCNIQKIKQEGADPTEAKIDSSMSIDETLCEDVKENSNKLVSSEEIK